MIRNSGVTIFLPIFEQKAFLHPCIKAIMDQTWTDFRVICYVDPNDSSAQQIINEISGDEERVQISLTVQQFVAEEINRELKNTEAEYVVFLKPGDLCKEQYLESGMKLAEQYCPQAVLFHSGRREIRFGTLRGDLHMMKQQN